MDFVVIDFETANLYRSSACSLSIVTIKDDQIVDTHSWLIRPEPFYFDWRLDHCTDEEMVENAPTIDKVWNEITPYLQGQLVVAHNASFDVSVLRRSAEFYNLPLPHFDILCTYQISKQALQDRQLISYRLDTVCTALGIPYSGYNTASNATSCANVALWAMKDKIFSLSDVKSIYNLTPGYLRDSYRPCKKVRPPRQRPHYPSYQDMPSYPDEDFIDKQFVFTGALSSMKREKAREIVIRGGGSFKDTLTQKADFLVCGLQDYRRLAGHAESSKMRKALDLQKRGFPIQIIDEQDFLNMIDAELYEACFSE